MRSVGFARAGGLPLVPAGSLSLPAGQQAVVVVSLTPGTCAPRRFDPGPSMSGIIALRVDYSAGFGLFRHSSVIVLPHPLELVCPPASTPPGGALLLHAGL